MTEPNSDEPKLEQEEVAAVEEASELNSKLIYEVIRRDGEEELARPIRALFWSGVAAGIMIGFSVLGEAIFRTYLPENSTQFLIENLGYSFGFLLVIMGRMQLFTENTLTTVLPLMRKPNARMFASVARLWSIVLSANVIGAFIFASAIALTPMIPSTLLPAIEDLSHHATGLGASSSFFRAIPAGILVAAIVWTLPQSDTSAVFVIVLFTWLIAAGDFTHVVAGSVEMAFLMVQGELGVLPAVTQFFLPVLAGNVVGGTAIFALMVWGQVREEIQET